MTIDQDRETIEVDILFVGAGPASLAGAIALAKLVQTHNTRASQTKPPTIQIPTIAVVEKGSDVGAHQISGAVIDPTPFLELCPNFITEAPLESAVTHESVYYLSKRHAHKFPFVPPQLKNAGNYVVSLSKLTKYLEQKAQEMGVTIFTNIAAIDVLYKDQQVVGVVTGDKGRDCQGTRKENYEPGVCLRAKCTVFGDGARGFLSKSVISKLDLCQHRHVATFETGVKEVWQCLKHRFEPGTVIHAMGYPLGLDTVGGSFLYGMKDNLLCIGLVVSLNYKNPLLEPYNELQKLKEHPFVSSMIRGGKPLAYGAKVLSSGGYYAIPRLYFNGGILVGESAQLLDISKLKGVHTAVTSGLLAAHTLFDLWLNDRSFIEENLQAYETRLRHHPLFQELFHVRNYHQALFRGLPSSMLHIVSQQFSRGHGIEDPMPTKPDREHCNRIFDCPTSAPLVLPAASKGDHFIDKLTSVFHSGTLHEENQPCHLKIQDLTICYEDCLPHYSAPCVRFCPAGVYEMLDLDKTPKLQINFTNCLHCQTCDIKCPKDNIRWTPPEGGGGPRYTIV